MDATTIKRELKNLTDQRDRLQRELDAVTADRDEALTDDRFQPDVVGSATQEIARLQRKIHTLELRIDALERQLPTSDETAEANAERARLLKRLAKAQERYRDAWSVVSDAVAELEPLANELVEARKESLQVEGQIKAHSQKFGIAAEAPTT